jgi:hypothetical protein
MAGNRTLKLSILADVDDLKKKLGQGEQEVQGFGNKLGEFGKKAAAAFAVAAAAAAAYAGKLLVDGVKAAIEDEKAQAKLATTLENTTGATKAQIAAVEDQILQMSLATGVADDQLRPSFEKLVRATNDVEKAQRLQTLALDIAAGSGKSLESVSQALARAYDGNNSALTRLGVGLSAAELKSSSFDQVTAKLAETFGGQASVQAETFEGKMKRLQVAFDEAKESVGARLLPILTNLLDKFTQNLGPAIEGIRNKFAPLTKAIEDNKEEFQAIWDFLNKYIVPILTGALKLAVSGLVTTFTTLVNIVGKAVNFFGNLYEAYKKFVDFIKNNPLSKGLGDLKDFVTGAGFTNAGFLTAGAGAQSQGLIQEDRENPLEQLFSNPNFTRNLVGGLSISEKQLIDRFIQGGQSGELINRFRPEMDLNPIIADIRGREDAYQRARRDLSSQQPIIVNVNSPSVIDEEGFSRAIVSALNNSTNRGTEGAAALRSQAAII